jgi:hypothetical protein
MQCPPCVNAHNSHQAAFLTFDSNFSNARILNRHKLKWKRSNMATAKASFAILFKYVSLPLISHIQNAVLHFWLLLNPLEKVEFALSCAMISI